ncbi:SDR family oxidoreductase [Zavarzinia aquatilis]|uniref:NAD(P)-dependent oxidoreductase n=1 Tax=Zavarzinia aquatilis TaxID=2211142 RepID=A0A317E3Z7_9PROT|nr:SDR family oxidoreductase [Zavarzinia aquatilis]PWR21104.1 NAD(P)-dependent oxidoreductase [Zavarzinia aquatilis]
MPRLFCFGLGYSALALAQRLGPRGFAIAGTVRTADKAERLRAQGIEVHLFDRGQPLADPEAALAGTTHLLSSVPPDEAGDAVVDHHGDLLARHSGLLWAGYLSTTGVYGDRGGDWIDEGAAIAPTGARGQRRAAAEAAWSALGLPLHIFRLAGIYGPGRNAIAQLRAGRAQAVVKPGQVFSRIHVEDIAAVLEASIARPRPGTAYNVCDDEPAPPWEVIEYAADLAGLPRPPRIAFEAAEMSAMARSFWAESKRVSNRRLHEELGVTLAYPSYREGLRALLTGGGA